MKSICVIVTDYNSLKRSLINMSVSSSHMSNLTAPKSPRVTSIRQAMYKKSPGRSPLREMIKSRCQERMRADREKLIRGVRNINMDDDRTFMERTIKSFIRVCVTEINTILRHDNICGNIIRMK